MSIATENFSFQKKLTIITVLLFLLKITAWVFTHSVAVLTDALEYTINVIAGLVSLYSLYLSAKPKDNNHPYGHGKAEFVSAAVEGILMTTSCFLIIYEAVNNLVHPHSFHKLDWGIYIVAFTALANFVMGYYAIKKGEKNNALTLIATGKHMQSDTYGTIAIIAGLIFLYFTKLAWIDSVISLVFAVVIFISGYKILRSSIAGIMDEADEALLDTVVKYLSEHRRQNWMDIHNLRIIKYGSILHMDCHVTIPWYFNIHQGHDEVKALEDMVRANFGEHVELFVHTDGCLPISCAICTKGDCAVRQHDFVSRVEWTVENVSSNSKHTIMARMVEFPYSNATIKELVDAIVAKNQIEGIVLNPPASAEAIRNFEKQMGFDLPEDFKEFYAICNGFECTDDMFVMIPLEDILHHKDNYGERWFCFSEYMIYCDSWALQITTSGAYEIVKYIDSDVVALTSSLNEFLQHFLAGGVFEDNGLYEWEKQRSG